MERDVGVRDRPQLLWAVRHEILKRDSVVDVPKVQACAEFRRSERSITEAD
jgi:hypothetical protein